MKTKLVDITKTITKCFTLLWKIDPFYFMVRLLGKIISPVSVVILSLLLKRILNFLVETEKSEVRSIFI